MDKPVTTQKRRVGKGNSNRKQKLLPHQTWEFKPRLENEAVVLHSILDIYNVDKYQRIVDHMRKLITQLVRNHGFNDGANRYNVIKNYTINLIELREPTNPPWLATSEKFNIPSKLGKDFCELLGDYFMCTDSSIRAKYMQVTLTTLNIVRIIEGLTDADFLSVTEKSKPIDSDLLKEFSAYALERLARHKFDPSVVDLNGTRFRLNKNGPNGKPKIESAYEEALCLLDSKLFRPFTVMCSELKSDYLVSYLEALKEIPMDTLQQPDNSRGYTTKLRLLAPVPDSGFKTRIVAIVDFWTQLVLEPIRTHVQMVVEKEFRYTDFRMDQTSGVNSMVDFQRRCLNEEYVKEHKLNIRSLKFYDISSWTDRFHHTLQKEVVKHLFSPRLAEAWAQLVVHCPWNVAGQDYTIKYGQGQGMGTNGSFDIATLTDHLFINFIIDKKSSISELFPNNGCYGKVGDDLWIYDPDDLIRKAYEDINLPINLSKSKEYSDIGSTAEFCSRTFLNGRDVSRISPKIISRTKDFRFIPTLLSLCASRGIQLYRSSFKILDRKVKNSEETYFDKLQPWIISLYCLGVKERSLARSLTMDYLVAGSWISDATLARITDPLFMEKLGIAHSIVSIHDSMKDIKDKTAETMQLQFSVSWTDWSQLTDSNLFMISSQNPARAFLKVDRTLLPKEIILLQRLADQSRLVYSVPTGMLELADGLEPIGELNKLLHKISVGACYDQGNINYDVKRYFDIQYSIVKVMERADASISVLRFTDSDEIKLIKSVMINDLMKQGWGVDLPELILEEDFDSEPSDST